MGQLLVRVKSEYEIPEDVSVTYCGRLDPAATGECLFLTGEDVYKKEEYLKRDKKYRAEILIGIGTDTGDLLGIPIPRTFASEEPPSLKGREPNTQNSRVEAFPQGKVAKPDRSCLEQEIKNLIGTHLQQPHPFSSFRIDGKPLWEHTKNNNEVEVPIKERTVYDAQLVSEKEISLEEVLERVKLLCSSVEGDFRQEEILRSWLDSRFRENDGYLELLEVEFSVSSGTFIRSLVETFSEKIGVPCCLFSLERTTC